MSGHSKWANIKHRKAAKDAKRSRTFQKITKEIMVAARSGGDPDHNAALRVVVDKAKAVNMPKDNIKRAILRGSGAKNSTNYHEISYEGYGPEGSAFLIDCLTDNINRAAALIRGHFRHCGGTLSKAGTVSYLFKRTAIIAFENDVYSLTEENILFLIENGAGDVNEENGTWIIETNPDNLMQIKKITDSWNIPEYVEFGVKQIASSEVKITSSESRIRIINFIEDLENEDDVQEVHHNVNLTNND